MLKLVSAEGKNKQDKERDKVRDTKISLSVRLNSPDGLEFGQKKLKLHNLNNVKHSKCIIIHRQRICRSAIMAH